MKRVLFLIVILIFCLATLSACSLFGGKIKLTEDMVNLKGQDQQEYEYTGEAIEFDKKKIEIRYDLESVDLDGFEFVYSNNVNVGTATLTISARDDNEKFKGSVSFNFKIVYGSVSVTSLEELVDALENTNFSYVRGHSITVPEDATITVPEGTTLSLGGDIRNYGKLVNYGELSIGSTTPPSVWDRDPYSGILNYGEVENNGAIRVNAAGLFINAGKVTNGGTFTHTGIVGSNDEKIPNVEGVGGQEQILRRKISNEIVHNSRGFNDNLDVINGMVYEQGKTVYEPSVVVFGKSAYDRIYPKKEYFDNDRAGTGHVKVTMDEKCPYYYGEGVVDFEIRRGVYSAAKDNEKDVLAAIQSGNYHTVNGDVYGVTVPEGVTVAIDEETTCNIAYLSVRGKLVNRGTVVVQRDFTLGGNTVFDAETVNYGTLTVIFQSTNFTDSFRSYGKLENYGKIAINKVYVTFEAGSEIVNHENAELEFGRKTIYSDKTVFRDIDVINEGVITANSSATCVESLTRFENSDGTFTAPWKIWTKVPLENVTGDVTLRRDLATVDVELTEDNIPYNEKSHLVRFKVDGNLLEEDGNIAKYEYRYDGAVENVNSPTAAGTVYATLTVTADEHEFYGTKTVPFTIVRSTVEVGSEGELRTCVKDTNYETVKLKNDIVSKTYNITVLAGVTLDTNGYRLTVEKGENASNAGFVWVYEGATLINNKPTDKTPEELEESDVGIWITNAGKIYNDGTVINNGIMLVEGIESYVQSGIYCGTTVNNKYVFCYKDNEFSVEGEGEIFVRDFLSKSNFSLEYTEIPYSREAFEPEVIFDNPQGSGGSLAEFQIDYSDNVNCGEASVGIKLPGGGLFNRYYSFGGTVLNFQITSYVYYIRAMKPGQSEEDYFAEINICMSDVNYIKVMLDCDLCIDCDVTLGAGVIFDTNGFSFRIGGTGKFIK